MAYMSDELWTSYRKFLPASLSCFAKRLRSPVPVPVSHITSFHIVFYGVRFYYDIFYYDIVFPQQCGGESGVHLLSSGALYGLA